MKGFFQNDAAATAGADKFNSSAFGAQLLSAMSAADPKKFEQLLEDPNLLNATLETTIGTVSFMTGLARGLQPLSTLPKIYQLLDLGMEPSNITEILDDRFGAKYAIQHLHYLDSAANIIATTGASLAQVREITLRVGGSERDASIIVKFMVDSRYSESKQPEDGSTAGAAAAKS